MKINLKDEQLEQVRGGYIFQDITIYHNNSTGETRTSERISLVNDFTHRIVQFFSDLDSAIDYCVTHGLISTVRSHVCRVEL